MIPWLKEEDIQVLRVRIDRGTEYSGVREHHEYELYLSIEDIDHTRTKARPLKPMASVRDFIRQFKMNFM